MTDANLDTTFQALADPTRRAIVARLRSGEAASLSDLAAPFDMSLPGVIKHVRILEEAGLVEREKIGRTVFCQLNAQPMAEAIRWLEEMEQFWSGRLDALAEHVEGLAERRQAAPSKGKAAPARSKSKRRT
ncbi:MAG: ArsR/SmtB family transcription factor [Hyphomicrobiaceae bacterium]